MSTFYFTRNPMKVVKAYQIIGLFVFCTTLSQVFNSKTDRVGTPYVLSHSIEYSDVLPEDRNYIEQSLPIIFPNGCESIAKVYPLSGGKSKDRLYVVLIGKHKFVVRFIFWAPDYIKQYEYSEMAAKKKLGPEIIYSDRKNAFFVMQFIEGNPLSLDLLEDKEIVWQLGQAMSCIHNAKPPTEDIFDVFERVEGMIMSQGAKSDKHYAELQECLPFIRSIKNAIEKRNISYKPGHHDVHMANIFYDLDRTIKFIDWGDAGLADPFHDLARISVNFAFSNEQSEILLESYYGKKEVSNVDRAHLFLMQCVVIIQYSCFLFGQEVIDSVPKETFLTYCRKVMKKKVDWVETPQDIAQIILDFFQNRVHSAEFEQALMLVGQ